MKNKGCTPCTFSGPLMYTVVKGHRAKNLQDQKLTKFWPKGPGDQGVWNVAIITAKGTSLRECTSSEPFCVKIVLGSHLQRWAGKKPESHARLPWNYVSPLTLGLRYRAACENTLRGHSWLSCRGHVFRPMTISYSCFVYVASFPSYWLSGVGKKSTLRGGELESKGLSSGGVLGD